MKKKPVQRGSATKKSQSKGTRMPKPATRHAALPANPMVDGTRPKSVLG